MSTLELEVNIIQSNFVRATKFELPDLPEESSPREFILRRTVRNIFELKGRMLT